MARTGLLAFLLLVAAHVVAHAGSISISITPTVELKDNALNVKVKVSNTGDEAAQSILPVLRFQGGEAKGQLKEQLGANETIEQQLSLPAPGLSPGRYPFRLSVDYTDLNQYPFQALQVSTVSVGTPPPAKVAATIAAEPLASSGDVAITVKNLTDQPRAITVAVHASDGIEVESQPAALTLAAWGTQTVTASINNRTALAGSRYPIFATAEFDADGAHQTVIGQGTVDIVPPRSFWAEHQQSLYIGAAVLLAAWVGGLVWWMAGRRAPVPNA